VFFGFYEKMFEMTYKGKPACKAEVFKYYIYDLIYGHASEMYQFGLPQVDKWKKFAEYLKKYSIPNLLL
jgi:hypothetical protein